MNERCSHIIDWETHEETTKERLRTGVRGVGSGCGRRRAPPRLEGFLPLALCMQVRQLRLEHERGQQERARMLAAHEAAVAHAEELHRATTTRIESKFASQARRRHSRPPAHRRSRRR